MVRIGKLLQTISVVIAFLWAVGVWAQGGAVSNIRNGPNLPALCNPNTGAIFFLTAANPAIGLYGCVATNTWALGAGAGGISIASNQIAVGLGLGVVGGSNNFTWNPTTQTFTVNGSGSINTLNSPLLNSVVALTPLTVGTHWTNKAATAIASAQCASNCTIDIPASVADDGSATTLSVPSGVTLRFTSGGTFGECIITMGKFSKIINVAGAILQHHGSNCTGPTYGTQATLQTNDHPELDNVIVDCNSQTNSAGMQFGSASTKLITNGLEVANCTNTGMNLLGAQFTVNKGTHLWNNTVGIKLYTIASAGGGNSNLFDGCVITNGTVGVVMNDSGGAALGMTANMFKNCNLVNNSVANYASKQLYLVSSFTVSGGTTEVTGSTSTVTIDGFVINNSSVYLSFGSAVFDSGFYNADATVTPWAKLINGALLTLENVRGYGNGSGVWANTDSTSTLSICSNFINVPNASLMSGTGTLTGCGYNLEAGTGAVMRTLPSKLGDVVSLFDFIPVADLPAIQNCTSTKDEAANIQKAIDAVRTGGTTSRHLYGPKGCYPVGSTLNFGDSTHTMKSFVFSGEGTYDNYASAATAFRWIGAANGTIMQLTAVQNATFEHFLLDGNGHSPGIGLLNTTLNSAGSNHNNTFNDIAVADIPGTPGRAISIDGNALATNQDVSSSSWSNIHIYPGISSSVVVGVYQNGVQTVGHNWTGYNSISGFTSRGMDFEEGDVRVDGVATAGPATGSNVDDFYVNALVDWVTFRNTYTEVNASNDNATRHVFHFDTGNHFYPMLISGSRIKWTLSSGNPLLNAMTISTTPSPLTLQSVSVDSSGTGVMSFGSTPTNLIGVNFWPTITYTGTNVNVLTSATISTTGTLFSGSGTSPAGTTAVGGFACTESASTGWTPTAGFDYQRCDSVTHKFVCSINGAAETGCGGGSLTINPTNNVLPKRSNSTTFVDSAITDNGTIVAATEPITTTGSVTAGSGCTPAGAAATGGICMTEAVSTGWTPTAGFDYIRGDSTSHGFLCSTNGGGEAVCATGSVTSITATSPLSGGTITVSGSIGITANGITATQLAAQYSKGSCTEVWGGSGTSFAMTAGDDAISNNSCYNDSGVTRTITALKCRSDNAANTTVLTPTFGSAGTGTAILTGTLTCGNSYAYSATGTLNNTAWTTGTGIDPGMSTVGNATSIAMIVEYTY